MTVEELAHHCVRILNTIYELKPVLANQQISENTYIERIHNSIEMLWAEAKEGDLTV